MTLPGLFLTGTDTGVGKTAVAAAIAQVLTAQGHAVGVLKPVASGAIRNGADEPWQSDDANALIAAIRGDVPLDQVTPFLFEPPLAPPVAARMSGAPLHWPALREAVEKAIDGWRQRGAGIILVEGVGGLLCPLTEETTVADLAIALDYPLIVVARRGLGTLNHMLLTLEAARHRGLRVAGVVLNGSEPTVDPLAEATNPEELVRWLGAIPLLAELPHDVHSLQHHGGSRLSKALTGVDWWERAGRPRSLPTAGDTQIAGPRS